MSRLFKKIQNTTIATTGNIKLQTYSPIGNASLHKKRVNYSLIVSLIFLFLGGLMAYLITDNMDCFYTITAQLDETKINEVKKVPEMPAIVNVKPLTISSAQISEIPVEEESDPISLEQSLKMWMSKKLKNPIFEKENIARVVNDLTVDLTAHNENLASNENDIAIELTPRQREHLRCIQDFLKRFQVECVRIDGNLSRVQANGRSYAVNTIVSQYPKLRLVGIANGEIIFRDDNNQEYRKEISQYE